MKYLGHVILLVAVAAVMVFAPEARDESAQYFPDPAPSLGPNALRSQRAVWTEMHKMANTLIVADEIWGEIEITEDKVTKLIIEITESDFQDKEELLEILERWKAGDFSKGVRDHNYLWSALEGTVGEAFELRDEHNK